MMQIASFVDPSDDDTYPFISIIRGGDLILEVRDGRMLGPRFEVASQVMWVASPVFRKMFGPELVWSEAQRVRRVGISGIP